MPASRPRRPAAQALRRAGAERVAVIDIDAHHGNGTQAIFYHRVDYGSVHVDPEAGWFPHYAGYAGERGSGANRAVKCRSCLGWDTMRIPGSSAARLATRVTTSIT